MTPRLNLFLLVVLLLVGVPLYWFQFDASAPGAKPLPLTIGKLRQLADEIPGDSPTHLHEELIGYRSVLHNQIAAGGGLRPIRLSVRAFELTVPDSGPIMIDAGTTPAGAEERHLQDYDTAAQARIDRHVEAAGLRLVLLDHLLHRGNRALVSPGARPLPDFSDGEPHAVAHGVVAIPLKGLPNRAMMVYARLENGREYLFTGDVATINENWVDARPPARTFSTVGDVDERVRIVSWLKTINALKHAAPAMFIVPGHDPGPIPGALRGFTKDRSR